MADPLSIAASLIAVLELTSKIISSCHKYRCGVQRAREDIARILEEAKALRDVLEEVIRLLEEEQTEGTANMSSLRKMNLAAGLFSELWSDLTHLEARLRPPMNKWKKLGDQLFWPLREDEVKRALENIQRLRSIVEFGLAVDSAASIMAMRKDISELKLLVIQLQTSPSPEQKLHRMLDPLVGPDHFESQEDCFEPQEDHFQPQEDHQLFIVEGTVIWHITGSQLKVWRDAPSSFLWPRSRPGYGNLCSPSLTLSIFSLMRDWANTLV